MTTTYKALLHLQGAKGLWNLKEFFGTVSEAGLLGEGISKQTTMITGAGGLTVRPRSRNNVGSQESGGYIV